MALRPDSLFSARRCWLRRRHHQWSRWVETMVGSYRVCNTCGNRQSRNFVETYGA